MSQESKAPSGHVGNLNDAQTKALASLKEMFGSTNEEAKLDDYDYLRFLRARSFDVKKALAMLTTHMQWRKDNNIDALHDNPPTEWQKTYKALLPHCHAGFDKEGRPIYVQLTGLAHGPLLMKYCPLDEVLPVHLWDMEHGMARCREQSQKLGRKVETVTNILDLSGWNLGHRKLIPYLQAISEVDENNYPETLGRTIVVNAPMGFSTIWALIKGFIDPVVASKVEILGSSYQEALNAIIDKDQLPSDLGGTMASCGSVDEKKITAILEAKEKSLNLKTETIAAGKKFQLRVAVSPAEQDQVVDWFYRTAANNVNFSAVFQPAEGKAVTVVAAATFQSHVCYEHGKYTVPAGQSGTMLLEWDNSASYWNSKALTYGAWVK